jgi:hypothetical protein
MNEIIISLLNNIKIKYVILNTGGSGYLFVHDNKIMLTRGRLFYVPINDTNLNLDDENVVKIYGSFVDAIDIRNVKDGFASVIPIVHNTVLKDGDVLGKIL